LYNLKYYSDKPPVTMRVYFWQATPVTALLFLTEGAAGDVFVLSSTRAVTKFSAVQGPPSFRLP
jgi:hypothetical protein